MNATSVPSVSRPRPTASAPSSSTITRVRFGITSRKVQNFADEPDLVHRGVVERRGAVVEAALDVAAPRPNDLITRKPTARLLDRVARSPCWSWTRAGDQRRTAARTLATATMIGTAATATTRPSGQYSWSSRMVTTTSCRMLITRNSSPKPMNRRMRGQVGGDPGQQLAALPAAVELHRQRLQPRVEVVAHGGLEAEDRAGLHPAADQDQHRLGDAEAEGQQAQREQPLEVARR